MERVWRAGLDIGGERTIFLVMSRNELQNRVPSGGSVLSRREALQAAAGGVLSLSLGASPALSQAARRDEPAARLDPALIDRAVQSARQFSQIHSLIIARGGEIAFAEAFRGPPLDRAVNIKSVSKSFVATLTGIAIDRGVLSSVDQKLAEIAPGLIPKDAEPRARDLTVAQLLTMQAGLERTSGPNYGQWVQSRNWVAYALTRPFIAEPGEGMLYSTGSYHVLGALLARASGKSLLTLAREWIGGPLDITIPPWRRDPQGFYFGGNDMVLSPMALLRFGELHRLNGVWNGKRLLSENWIRDAWTPRTLSPYSGDDYGYGWFVASLGGQRVIYARGYGGQMVYIVPSLGLTVVVTSDPTQPARSDGYVGQLRGLLASDIIPAAA
jgi:CubicO group peptidase (beta-lactamase class C family)